MTGWAVDTAIAVSVLIAAVLLIRRPFAAAFGARAAFAPRPLNVREVVLCVAECADSTAM